MINLASTSDAISVVTSAAGAVQVHASFVDLNGTTATPGRINTPSIATATTTAIVPAPAASTVRGVNNLSIVNASATITNTVTVNHTDGTNNLQLITMVLAPYQALRYIDGSGWSVLPM